jgi:hypothetical protein
MATAAASATSSCGLIWNRNASNARDAARVASIPMARPTAAIHSASPSTTDTTLARWAPRATRIPISLVRRATVHAKVPYKPTPAISTASRAKQVHSAAKVRSWLMD